MEYVRILEPCKSQWTIVTDTTSVEFIAVQAYSKYSRNADLMTPSHIKNMIWDNFARTISL